MTVSDKKLTRTSIRPISASDKNGTPTSIRWVSGSYFRRGPTLVRWLSASNLKPATTSFKWMSASDFKRALTSEFSKLVSPSPIQIRRRHPKSWRLSGGIFPRSEGQWKLRSKLCFSDVVFSISRQLQEITELYHEGQPFHLLLELIFHQHHRKVDQRDCVTMFDEFYAKLHSIFRKVHVISDFLCLHESVQF